MREIKSRIKSHDVLYPQMIWLSELTLVTYPTLFWGAIVGEKTTKLFSHLPKGVVEVALLKPMRKRMNYVDVVYQ